MTVISLKSILLFKKKIIDLILIWWIKDVAIGQVESELSSEVFINWVNFYSRFFIIINTFLFNFFKTFLFNSFNLIKFLKMKKKIYLINFNFLLIIIFFLNWLEFNYSIWFLIQTVIQSGTRLGWASWDKSKSGVRLG